MICWYFPIHYYNYNIGSADWTVNVVCVTSETMSQVFWDLAMPGHVRWQLSTHLFSSPETSLHPNFKLSSCIEVTLARCKALHFVSFFVITQIMLCEVLPELLVWSMRACKPKSDMPTDIYKVQELVKSKGTASSRVMLMLQQKGLHQCCCCCSLGTS